MSTSVGRGLTERITEAQELLRRDPQRSLDLVHDLDPELLDPSSAIDVLSIRSRACIHLGRYADGQPLANAALELARQAGLRVKEGLARNEVGVYHFVQGEFDLALNHYAAAEQLLRDVEEAGRGRVFVNIANVYNYRGDYLNALIAYERALAIARERNDQLTQAKIYSNMAGLYRHTFGSLELAGQYLEEATALYEALDDRVGMAKCLVNRAGQFMAENRPEEARDFLRRSLEIREAFSEPDDLMMTYDGLISALIRTGEIDEAASYLEKAEEVFQSLSVTERAEPYLKFARARIFGNTGQSEEALAICEEVVSTFETGGQMEFAIELKRLMADLYLTHGEAEKGARLLQEVMEHMSSVTNRQATERMAMLRAQVDLMQANADVNSELIRRFEVEPTKERLHRAEATNEEFIAVLAHELKSPLHTIRSVMSLLANADAVSKEERQEYGRAMLGLSTRLIDQITTTLAAAKQQHETARSVVNARTVWEYVLEGIQMGTSGGEERVSWTFDRDKSIPSRPMIPCW